MGSLLARVRAKIERPPVPADGPAHLGRGPARPAQTVLAWRLAHRDIRRHGGWFVYYLVMSSLFYTAFKNLIAVVAQVNEAMQQRKWMITPRTARVAATAAESILPGA